jgi:hypothetical protein
LGCGHGYAYGHGGSYGNAGIHTDPVTRRELLPRRLGKENIELTVYFDIENDRKATPAAWSTRTLILNAPGSEVYVER